MSANVRRILPALIILVTLGIGIVIGTIVSRSVRAAKTSPVASDAKPLPAPSPAELSNSFAQIAEALEPSVVNINAESTVRMTRRRFRVPDDSPFNDFFDHFFQGPEAPFGDFRQESLGSGVILDKNGYILTNYHVVTQGGEDKLVDRIVVYLHGDSDTRYRAKVIGSDKWTDLAVIKIEPGKPLSPAQFGDSDAMRVGDWVLAIGRPFDLDSTVTAGIVSAKGRDIELGTRGQFKRYIQTDAAINPGNSGGPLVNLAAQVIGINTAIATHQGSYEGVGFAIPSNTARKVYNALITTGSVRRGAIGVNFEARTSPAALRVLGADHGIVISSVQKGSPAERAGLKRGDVILSVQGKPIRSGDELVALVSETPIGGKLRIEYLRDNRTSSTEVEVGDRNIIVAEQNALRPDETEENPGEGGGGGALGVSVKNLTRDQAQELAEQLHLDAHQGVLVTDVQLSGFASDLGVHHGDVILSINRHPVASVEDFNHLQSQLKSGNDVLLLIARRSSPRGWMTLFLADRLP
jgi:serine protease Do